MTDIFLSLLISGSVGTLLALLLMILRPVTNRYFSSSWHYYMWFAVLLVMVIPLRVDVINSSTLTDEYYIEYEIPSEKFETFTDGSDAQSTLEYRNELVKFVKNINNYAEHISNVWFIISLFLLLIYSIRYLAFLSKLEKRSEIIPCPIISEYTDHKVITYVYPYTTTPMLVGFIKPKLILPCVDFSTSQLRNILAHETVHLNRGDILIRHVVNIVKCLFWYNPMIYKIEKEIAAECEISCDITATKDMSLSNVQDYMETILSLITNKKSVSFTTEMSDKKRNLKRRFKMIKNNKNTTKKVKIISTIIAVLLIVGALITSGIFAAESLTTAENDTNTENINENTDISTEDTISENNEDSVKILHPLPENNGITQPFGTKTNPVTGVSITHNAVDIAADAGTPVLSAISGEVKESEYKTDLGNYVLIENDDTSTLYAHLSETTLTKGDTVNIGDTIGKVGQTGDATGPHLHFELKINGEYVDPVLVSE